MATTTHHLPPTNALPRGSMPDYHYLIIGGGLTADAAALGIR